MNIEALLTDYSLHIDPNFEEFASKFCNIQGFKEEKTKTMFLLDSWFEGYLYCVIIGLIKNDRKKFSSAKKEKARTWSKEHREQLAYVLSLILGRDDIKNELNIYTRSQIKTSFTNEDDFMKQLKSICDEFSNGGLNYLRNEYEKNEYLFEDYDSLKDILIKCKG